MWSIFDSIEVITVPESTRMAGLIENLEAAQFNMKDVNINTFERVKTNTKKNYSMFTVPFIKTDCCCDDVCKDTGRHHIDIIKKAYANPLKKRILIFEDDARFNMPFNFKKIKKVLNWLEKNDQCEILYFGSLPFLSYPVNSYILKTHKPYLIHCYCLNRSGIKKILDTVDCEKGCVMDVQFSNIPGLEKYSVYPSINNQESPGDYSKSKLSKYIKFNRVTFFVDNSFYIYIVIFFIIILLVYISFKTKKPLIVVE